MSRRCCRTHRPKEIIDRLTKEILAVMNDPAAVKQFTDQQLVVMTLEQDRFRDLIKKDLEKWGKVTKTAGIQMEQ
ncbi:MAG: hypothetical protein HY244_00240 [Rhizobiales bacterium]|nr:hypothetical protein [Hyphomicrobiales bacterium]